MIAKYSLHAFLFLVLMSHPVIGDTVRTRSGAVYDGEVQLEVLRLKVVDGEIEVPWAAVRSVRASAGGLAVVLSDDTSVIGVLVELVLRVTVGVIVRSIPFDDVDSIDLSTSWPEKQIRQALKAGEFGRANLATPEIGTFETSCPMRLELGLPSQPMATI